VSNIDERKAIVIFIVDWGGSYRKRLVWII